MNDEDRTRFVANFNWFNQFLGSVKQLYGIVVETLPTEFFPEGFSLKWGNFYFPKQNTIPSIPPYYVLMCGGRQFALQLVAVFDPDLFDKRGDFAVEPSFVVVLHSRADRYAYIDDHALRVIGNKGIEFTHQADGKFSGTMHSKPPADFFTFQVSFDKFSTDQNSREAVGEHIVAPIIEYLEKR
ncbi:MAG: hypothetical protein M3494_03255 [Actinomycetota bacterium]|jgi:hypothetical protein|nr:hypothetical protein [Actinomycetota bacterium]